MALITTAEAKEMLPSLGSSTAQDTLISTLITIADTLLAGYCLYPPAAAEADPTLESATYTQYFDAPDWDEPRRLTLPVRPVTSITSVHSDPTWGYGSSYEIVAGNRTLDGIRGQIWINPDASDAFYHAPRATKVIYVAGFATVPENVKMAARLTVKHLLERLPHTQGMTETTQRGVSQKLDHNEFVPAAAKALLSDVRLWEGSFG